MAAGAALGINSAGVVVGAEVVEAAFKLARHHTRRQNVVAFLGAFHGRTYGAVSLTGSKAKYHLDPALADRISKQATELLAPFPLYPSVDLG